MVYGQKAYVKEKRKMVEREVRRKGGEEIWQGSGTGTAGGLHIVGGCAAE